VELVAAAIPDDVSEFIDTLVAKYVGIRQVWLIGSRAKGAETSDSDWDLLVFGDAGVLSSLRLDGEFPALSTKLRLDLLLVYDSEHFVEPWASLANEKRGSLSGWKWRELSSREAVYEGKKLLAGGFHIETIVSRGYRVWPSSRKPPSSPSVSISRATSKPSPSPADPAERNNFSLVKESETV
jgi:predicted nucleotidyltransferase